MNQLTLSPTEKIELKEAAVYISYDLPPREDWVEIRQVLPPEVAININDSWGWLGTSLHAFFGDYSDPLPNSGLEETFQQLIQEKSTKYIALSALIFQAERFLKQEAKARGLPVFWRKRSEILEVWAFEHCKYEILLCQLADWESHSEQSRDERLKKIKKYILEDLKEDEFSELNKKWEKQDAKLCRPPLNPSKVMPFSYFCIDVFHKYRSKLHAFEFWVESSFSHTPGLGKFRQVNGRIKFYPGRGKGKSK